MQKFNSIFCLIVCGLALIAGCSHFEYLETKNLDRNTISERLVSLYGEGGLSPTKEQWRAFLEHPDFTTERIVLLDLVEFQKKDKNAGATFDDYLKQLTPGLNKRGGKILMRARADHALIGRDADAKDWSQIVFIQYPSRAAYIDLMLDPGYAKIHEPGIGVLRRRQQFVTDAGPFSSPRWIANILYSARELTVGADPKELLPRLTKICSNLQTEPAPEHWTAMLEHPEYQNGPYLNLNFTKYRAQSEYTTEPDPGGTGAEAYKRYASAAAPMLVARRGWPVLVGKVQQMLVGKNDPGWDVMAFVEWPSRRALIDMATDPEYPAAWHHRKAGVDRAVTLATTKIE